MRVEEQREDIIITGHFEQEESLEGGEGMGRALAEEGEFKH